VRVTDPCAIAHKLLTGVCRLGSFGPGSEMEMQDRRVIVIGAGPAGLASAALLRRKGVPSLVLERSSRVASSWRGRYDRLRLNSSRPFSRLAGARYPQGTGMFPARDEMVRYLENYAQRNHVDVRHGAEVERIDREGSELVVRMRDGEERAQHVIVATGYAHTPYIPDWPGRDSFRGRLMHSADYRNADDLQGADVIVAGSGCSGMEIAYDVATGGAKRVRVAVRTPPNILVRDPVGPLLALIFLQLPTRFSDNVLRNVQLKKLGDLSAYGLPIPDEGVFSRLKRLGVAPAIVDKEVIDAVKDGRIEIVAGIRAVDEGSVELDDDSRAEPDAVIAATGYRSALEPLVGHLGVLNERGLPAVADGRAVAPGLRFVGFVPRPAQLGGLGMEARRAARGIARELQGEPSRGRRRTRAPRPQVV
jgi:cation diffusion facilitator CzcD-associated flavoprotein CzcO